MKHRFSILAKCLLLAGLLVVSVSIQAQSAYKVTARNLNVRLSPSVNGQVVGRLSEGSMVSVSEIKGDWAAITYNGATCYVSAQYLEQQPVRQPASRRSESRPVQQPSQPERSWQDAQSLPVSDDDGHRGIDFGVSAGCDFALKDGGGTVVPLELEIGKRFNKNFYWGGAAGVTIPLSAADIFIPVTTNLKAYFPHAGAKVVPFVMFRAGYQFNTADVDLSSILLQLMPGLEFPLSQTASLQLAAGYTRAILARGGGGINELGFKTAVTFHKSTGGVRRELPPSHDRCFQVGIEPYMFSSSDVMGCGAAVVGTYKWSRLLSFGLGYGFGANFNDNEFTQHRLFVRGQYRRNDNLWSPFIAGDLGFYSADFTPGYESERGTVTGVFFTPAVGLSLRSSANSYVDFRLGYQLASKAGEKQLGYGGKLDALSMSCLNVSINFTRTLK